MNWLLFMFMLEVGFLPQGDLVMYNSETIAEVYPVQWLGYTDLGMEIQLGNILFVGGGVKTMLFAHPSDVLNVGFFPYGAQYRVNAGIRFRGVEVGFRHYCIHPVMPWVGIVKDYEPTWEGWYEEVYFRVGTWRGTDRRW